MWARSALIGNPNVLFLYKANHAIAKLPIWGKEETQRAKSDHASNKAGPRGGSEGGIETRKTGARRVTSLALFLSAVKLTEKLGNPGVLTRPCQLLSTMKYDEAKALLRSTIKDREETRDAGNAQKNAGVD